jgi:AraC-like DNA-binding protein
MKADAACDLRGLEPNNEGRIVSMLVRALRPIGAIWPLYQMYRIVLLVELMGRYSNPDIVAKFQRILAGQVRGRPPARTTRSLRQKQAQHRLNPDEVDQLLQCYRAGTKIDDLAAEFAINRNTVMEHVRRAGAPRRRNIVLGRLDEARRLYEQGWSLARVAQQFGVDPGTVGYTFRKAGIPRRDTHGR